MPKFICTKSLTKSVPEGTILVGAKINKERFVLVYDSDLQDPSYEPRWLRGYEMPINGELWSWEEV